LAVRNQPPRLHELPQEEATFSEGGKDGEVFGSRGHLEGAWQTPVRIEAKVSTR
jgi:hypothetical protein